MGIRNRTPIGTLREQRKNAESAPQVEAQKPKTTAPVRVHAQKRLDETLLLAPEKTESLIERLRTVLRGENPAGPESESADCHILQDELVRISQHHQQHQSEHARELIDVEPPRKYTEAGPLFRYVVIDGGKKSDDFIAIPKLDRAPSNFDSYTRSLPKDPAPRLRPLTLLVSEVESKAPVKKASDPSQEAASFTQSSVTCQPAPNKGSVLPKSLVLSLLGGN